jgi:hypothetical protein
MINVKESILININNFELLIFVSIQIICVGMGNSKASFSYRDSRTSTINVVASFFFIFFTRNVFRQLVFSGFLVPGMSPFFRFQF